MYKIIVDDLNSNFDASIEAEAATVVALKDGKLSTFTIEKNGSFSCKGETRTKKTDGDEKAVSVAEVQEGFAELEALPILEHKPQMPEEKKELVSLLMGFVKTAAAHTFSKECIKQLPAVAAVLADLVN